MPNIASTVNTMIPAGRCVAGIGPQMKISSRRPATIPNVPSGWSRRNGAIARRILTALTLYDPKAQRSDRSDVGSGARAWRSLREVLVALD